MLHKNMRWTDRQNLFFGDIIKYYAEIWSIVVPIFGVDSSTFLFAIKK